MQRVSAFAKHIRRPQRIHSIATYKRWDTTATNPDVDMGNKLFEEGLASLSKNHIGKAHEQLTEALALFEKGLGTDHSLIATCLNNLAETLRMSYHEKTESELDKMTPEEKFKKADELYKRAISIREKVDNRPTALIATIYNNMGLLYHSIPSRLKECEQVLSKGLEIRRALFEKCKDKPKPETDSGVVTDPDYVEEVDLGRSLNNLGLCYQNLTKHYEASNLLKEALAIFDKQVEMLSQQNNCDPEILQACSHAADLCRVNLALSLGQLGKIEQAQTLVSAALPKIMARRGKYNAEVASAMNVQALIYYHGHQYHVAEQHLKTSIEIYSRVLHPLHPTTALVKTNLAACLQKLGKGKEAQDILKDAKTAVAASSAATAPDKDKKKGSLFMRMMGKDKK